MGNQFTAEKIIERFGYYLTMECQKEKNLKTCPCTYPNCPRKGICCECIRHHLAKNELPGCCFSKEAEAIYDRSIEKFIKDQKK